MSRTAARPDARSGPLASLGDILSARDDRVERRRALIAETGLPVVTVTTVMPGPVKDCALSRIPFAAALQAIEAVAATETWPCGIRYRVLPATGPEAFVVIDANARAVKRAMVALEETHPLGRLFDLDVMAADGGSIGRADLGLSPRRCLLCDRPAKDCGRARAHPLDELLARMEERIDAWHCHPA